MESPPGEYERHRRNQAAVRPVAAKRENENFFRPSERSGYDCSGDDVVLDPEIVKLKRDPFQSDLGPAFPRHQFLNGNFQGRRYPEDLIETRNR